MFFCTIFRWGILLMYKKFLVSMLLTAALVGCNHQPSDKQGDQSDTAMPVQDQMANPANASGSDEQIPVNPQAVEPTQTPPDATTPATPATPDASSNNSSTDSATPAEPAKNDNSANSAAGAQ
jgi:cytoskeletal protein RodZ